MLGRAHADRGPHPSTLPVYAVGVALCLAVAAGLSFASADLVPFVAALAVLGIAAFAFLARPATFLAFVLLTSAIAGLRTPFDELPVAGTDLTVSGLRWIFVAAFLGALILLHLREVGRLGVLLPMSAFVAIVALRFVTARHPEGTKDVLFYTLPLLAAAFVGSYAVTRRRLVAGTVAISMLAAGALIAALYVVLFATGRETFTPDGPYGPLMPRPTSLFLLIALAASLALWRAPPSPRMRPWAQASSWLAFGLIVFTMSRTSSVVALLMIVLHRVDPNRRRQLVAGAVAGTLLFAALILYVPALNQRFFHEGVDSVSESFQSLNTMGRAARWSHVWESAVHRPLFGHGLGQSRIVVADVAKSIQRDAPHPHNEYLQAFHDLGLIGVLLLVLAWGALAYRHWRGWCEGVTAGDPETVRWHLAAFLALFAILSTSVTDNTLHYAFVVVPAAILSGLALASDRARAGEAS